MNKYELKRVLAVDSNLSLKECQKMLFSEECCLGILDGNREIVSFVTKEDLLEVLKFNLENYPISLIATLADSADIDIKNINESELKNYIRSGLNKGIFVGKDKRSLQYIILDKDSVIDLNDKYLREEYEKNIPLKIKKALKYCYLAADKISLPIYLIGGIVRDIVINSKNDTASSDNHYFDVDITVEENAIGFSRFLVKEYPEICKIKEIHEDFKTSKVILFVDGENIELDIASTRKESYLIPASLPTVKDIGCSILDDLERRDFTINSMALSLNQNSFCRLIDPLNGYNDILDAKIRILHPISFVDDPTRIVRAIKFGTRFNYDLEKSTKKLLEVCIDSGIFNNLGGERIKSEIKQTLNLNKAESFNIFIAERAYNLVDTDIIIPANIQDISKKIKYLIQKYCNSLKSKDFIWLVYLGVLTTGFEKEKIIEIAERLRLSGIETEILLGAKCIINKLNLIKTAKTKFKIYETLEGYFTESVLIALACTDDQIIEEKIDLFEKELKDIKVYTTGKDLIAAGLVPGPAFGEVLKHLLHAKVNGEISTQEDEAEYLKSFIAKELMN